MVQIIPRLLLAAWFFLLFALETKRPLRHFASNRLSHVALNVRYFLINIMLNTLLAYYFLSTVDNTSSLINLPEHFLKPLGIIIFLDLVIYIWHRLNHEVDFLWRFHKFHHSDREMDASTALRFHMGEFILSAGFKALIIIIFGVSLKEYIAFELIVTASVLFHHSNLNIGTKLDEKLRAVVVTPMYHHLHHADEHNVMNSNYGTLFSFWDKIFRTRTYMATEKVTIGLKEYPATPGFTEGLKSFL